MDFMFFQGFEVGFRVFRFFIQFFFKERFRVFRFFLCLVKFLGFSGV